MSEPHRTADASPTVSRISGTGRLRVLRLIARLNTGGPARHAIILDQGLGRRGFETLLIHGSVGPGEQSLESLALERGVPTTYVRRFGRALSVWDDLLALVTIVRLMCRWRPDIVHTHTAKAGTLGRLAALVFNLSRGRLRRCGVIHTFHGHVLSGYFGAVGNALVRTVERLLALNTDRIVTISPTQRDDIVRRFSIARADQVVVIPLGLELGPLLARPLNWRGMRTALGYGDSEFVVGYVGRLVRIKDLGTLLRGVALARRRLASVQLVIAGDGEERPYLEALMRDLDLADHVRLLGWQDDLVALYASMDLFVLTSINEGTPVSLIEAMAAGVPCVATAVGGVPDVFENAVTGVLISARSPTAVSDAILSAAEDRAPASACARRAREHVAQRYDSERLVEDVDSLYRELLARKRGTRVQPGAN